MGALITQVFNHNNRRRRRRQKKNSSFLLCCVCDFSVYVILLFANWTCVGFCKHYFSSSSSSNMCSSGNFPPDLEATFKMSVWTWMPFRIRIGINHPSCLEWIVFPGRALLDQNPLTDTLISNIFIRIGLFVPVFRCWTITWSEVCSTKKKKPQRRQQCSNDVLRLEVGRPHH